MTRNWVMKLLTACVAISALVFVYSAYHTATFLISFPDSTTVRWADRYTEVFPTFVVVPRTLFHLTGTALFQPGNATRWPGVLLHLLLAVAMGVLAYGLARYRKWARLAFGTVVATFAVLQLFKLFPVVLHLFVGSARSYLAGLASERIGPLYTFFGIIVSIGCAWLMWRWRDEPEQAATSASSSDSRAPARTTREDARRLRLRKSIRWIWVGEVLIASALVLGSIPGTRVSVPALSQHIADAVILLLVLASIGYLLSREEPRFGIGMAAGFGVLQLLPYVAISISPYPIRMMFLLGVQGLGSLVIAVLPALGAFIMSIAAVQASIQAGRPTARMAGKWGVGVVAVLLAGVVHSQIAEESTYAKGPALSRERESQQSEEFQRGHAAQRDVLMIGKCVFQYAAAHPDEGFPGKLEQIGPGGSGCFRDVNGVSGHVFIYEASSSADKGVRDRFTARSKETEHISSTFSLPDKMVDESGILAAMEGEKRGFAFSPALVLVKNIGDCLKIAFDANSGDTYPADLHRLLSIKAQYGVPCIQPYEAKDLSVLDLWRNRFRYRFYKFEYQPTNAVNGKYMGFRLDARPQEYGEQALRSYFLSEAGVVHATPQDREATAEDADANCEFQQKDCTTAAAISLNETTR